MVKRRGRGEGSLEQLPSGSWRAELSAGPGSDGKPLRVRQTFKKKAPAVEWLAEQRSALGRGEIVGPTRLTVGEYAARWLALRKLSVKGSAGRFYEGVIADHITPRLGTVRLSALNKPRVENWLAELAAAGVSGDRMRKALTTLRTILSSAAEDRVIPRSPAAKVKRPRHKPKEIRFWSADEARSVVKAATGRRLGALFMLALDAGCRIGELQALHWPEVDLDAGTVRIIRTLDDVGEFTPPKTAKARRTIQVDPNTVAALRTHRAEMVAEGRDVQRGLVFPAKRSGHVLAYNTLYRRYFGGLVKAAGVPWIGPHGMRHTCATLLLRAGAWVKSVSERLGHEDIETTLRLYAHTIPGDDAKLARVIGGILYDTPTSTPRAENDAAQDKRK